MCFAVCVILLAFGNTQGRQEPRNAQRYLQAITFTYFPQRSANLVEGPIKGKLDRVKLGGFSTTVTDKREREGTATANGKFVYVSAVRHAHISQYRVGNNGLIQPLIPANLRAGSHPTSLSFHPTGNTLYVACSHGAICQFHVNPNGSLTPLNPLEVYGESDPSPLRFDRAGHYACAVTQGVGGQKQLDVYRVTRNGTLKLDRRLSAENVSVQSKGLIVRGGIVEAADEVNKPHAKPRSRKDSH